MMVLKARQRNQIKFYLFFFPFPRALCGSLMSRQKECCGNHSTLELVRFHSAPRLSNSSIHTAEAKASLSQEGCDGPENRNHSVPLALQIDWEQS